MAVMLLEKLHFSDRYVYCNVVIDKSLECRNYLSVAPNIIPTLIRVDSVWVVDRDFSIIYFSICAETSWESTLPQRQLQQW